MKGKNREKGFNYVISLMRSGRYKEAYRVFEGKKIPLILSLELIKEFLCDRKMIKEGKDSPASMIRCHEKHMSMVTQACYMTMFYLLSEEGNAYAVDAEYNDNFFYENGKYDDYPRYYDHANWIPPHNPLIDIVVYQREFIQSVLVSEGIEAGKRSLLLGVVDDLNDFMKKHYEVIRTSEDGSSCVPRVEYLQEKRERGADYLEAMDLQLFSDGWTSPPRVDADVIFFPFLRWQHHLSLCHKLDKEGKEWRESICDFYSVKDISIYLS